MERLDQPEEHRAQAAEHQGQVEPLAQPAVEVSPHQVANPALVQTLDRAPLAAVVAEREPLELSVRAALEVSLASQSGLSAKSSSRERRRA